MAQFTEYRSTDTSAPVLTGQTGKLIALLDAILINGYGSKAAAGWGKPFGTGTSTKEAYRPASGTRFYVRVLDDGSMTGGFRDSSVRGGESMSDIDTFTNAFPTAVQEANGVNWRKSVTADATARPWIAFADGRTLYLFIQSGDNSTQWVGMMFGDFYSYNPTDAFNCMIAGMNTFSASSISASNHKFDLMQATMQGTVQSGHYIARKSTGTGASTNCCKKGEHGLVSTGGTTAENVLAGILSYPNTADGGLWLHPVWIMDIVTPDVIHGHLRGFYHICHAITFFGDGDTFGGAGGYAGRSFKLIKQSMNAGIYTLETSNTLDTN